VFKAAPGDPEWRRFWTVLIHAAANLVHEDHWRFEPYYCVRADDPGPDLARLCHDAAEHRLAGIFYANTPPALPAVRRLHVPCVAVTAFDLDWLTTITIDQEDFLRKSVDWLAKRGCHRIGLLAVPTYDETLLPAFREQVAASGMSYAERWLQLCNQSYPHWAANITELLFSTSSKTRPDGLIIADDNLTADACRGLSAAGLEPGRHVHVVSHANFPAANQPGNSGVQRIGYDNTMILRQVLDCISNKTHPRKNPSRIVIAACLESDSLQNTPAANLQRQLPSR
jgi:DNA-binding LacI/PurR family transcriptional regulator